MKANLLRKPAKLRKAQPRQPKCPDCEEFIDGQWRTGRCDDCRGVGRDERGKDCRNCLGKGSSVCCRCEGTGVNPEPAENSEHWEQDENPYRK